jgi:hypothetical protein
MVDVGLDSEGKARGSKRPRIKQKYEWNDKGDVIGEGTYGLVFRAKHKVPPRIVNKSAKRHSIIKRMITQLCKQNSNTLLSCMGCALWPCSKRTNAWR